MISIAMVSKLLKLHSVGTLPSIRLLLFLIPSHWIKHLTKDALLTLLMEVMYKYVYVCMCVCVCVCVCVYVCAFHAICVPLV